VLCVAIDLACLRPLGEFTAELERVLAHVRDVPLEVGVDADRFPGESGAAAQVARLRNGVPMHDGAGIHVGGHGRRDALMREACARPQAGSTDPSRTRPRAPGRPPLAGDPAR
jgi:hypothetical protein